MFTGLVMAGRRPASDAFANVWGAQHRALIDVNGVPMLLRVVRALRAAENVGRILVSIDEPAALEAVPELRRWVADGALTLHASLATPSRSVLDVLKGPADGEPVLVVTADHALLTSEMVDAFAQAAAAESADVLVGPRGRGVGARALPRRHPHLSPAARRGLQGGEPLRVPDA